MADLVEAPVLTEQAITLDVFYRLATPDDLPRLEWFGEYTHFRRLYRQTYAECVKGKRAMLVADVEGYPVGQIFIHFDQRARGADRRARAYLYSLRVMPMFRGKGIGTCLIELAEVLCLQRGFTWASIAVAKDNPRARGLYERLGYGIVGDDDGQWSYMDHRNRRRTVQEPSWVLEKQLSLRYNS
jgi:ribosomal protein S18 acetylase RimI-like enzyme